VPISRVGGQTVWIGIAVGDEGVAWVLARQNSGQTQAIGKIHRYIFHGMNGQIGAAFQQTLFQLLDE
jgi:hypothetical protein